jgi:hypothetical protein
MYGHNIVVRLHGFFCTLYTIIYVRFLYPICTPYVGYMKSKIFQKSQNKAKIRQKSQNWPKRPNFSKKSKKKAKKKQNLPKDPNFGFLSNFGFFWNFLENLSFFGFFWIFGEISDFLEQVCCLSFRRLHKNYIDREYMTQSR